MLRIIVDSGASIRQEEKAKYNLDILPLRINIDDKEYLDGIDLTADNLYTMLDDKHLPKTSLPSLGEAEDLIQSYLDRGDEVLVITISSYISGTYQSLKMLFEDNPHVLVYDSWLVVGGIRFLVEEAIKYRDTDLQTIKAKLDDLRPRIVEMGIPSTLDYLLAGGRLSKAEWMIGSLFTIRPVVSLKAGQVNVVAKKRGLKHAMHALIDEMQKTGYDKNYGLLPSYTKTKENAIKLMEHLSEEERQDILFYDDIAASIACHIGPDGCGLIYVEAKA